MTPEKQRQFGIELTQLLNRYSAENDVRLEETAAEPGSASEALCPMCKHPDCPNSQPASPLEPLCFHRNTTVRQDNGMLDCNDCGGEEIDYQDAFEYLEKIGINTKPAPPTPRVQGEVCKTCGSNESDHADLGINERRYGGPIGICTQFKPAKVDRDDQ